MMIKHTMLMNNSKEMPMERTLEIKDEFKYIVQNNQREQSLIPMPSIMSKSEKLIVISYEPTSLSNKVQEKILKPKNLIVKWNSSGKMTKELCLLYF